MHRQLFLPSIRSFLSKPYLRSFSTESLGLTESMKKFGWNHKIPDHALISKVTNTPILLDQYGRFHNYLRISLTERCNFKCQYCTVSDANIEYTPKNKLLKEDDFLRMIHLFVKAGVDKIRLTGGEPTIYKGLSRMIYEIGKMPQVKILGMTTNGATLYKKLDEYKQNGLNRLNISLDTFCPQKNEMITQTKFHGHVIKSIDKAISLGFEPLKINCVVMRGINDNEIYDFVEYTREQNVNVRFIEFFAIGDNRWTESKMVKLEEMIQIIEQKYGKLERENDHYTETAKNFRLPGFKGSISFISSVSVPFCAGCNRIRLLSSGDFRRCLHDDNMLNLRSLIEQQLPDDIILEAISHHLKGKYKHHAGMDFISTQMKYGKSMVTIGG